MSRRAAVRLAGMLASVEDEVARATLPPFGSGEKDVLIKLPREIRNPQLIRMGRRVRLGPNCVLKANTAYPGGWLAHPEGQHVEQTFEPLIEIGDGVTATAALQLVAFERISIEEDVMFAANVFVSDGTHGYSSGEVPYKYQGIERIAPVRIRAGSWIGQNVVVMPGVSIGRQSLIGANSVVSSDVPDGCVAVGAPARVVRRWDSARETWRPVDRDESVLAE
jgi:acetyltransferase-like isoleucine patch superfamily enzyme